MKPTVTVDEAARILGCSRRNVYYLIHTHRLQAFKVPQRSMSLRVIVPAEWPIIWQGKRQDFVKRQGQSATL